MATKESTQHARNSAVYDRLKPEIDRVYPLEHFVAIYDGRIIADASSFHELYRILGTVIESPRNAFIVQAGVDYPKEGVILLPEIG